MILNKVNGGTLEVMIGATPTSFGAEWGTVLTEPVQNIRELAVELMAEYEEATPSHIAFRGRLS